MNQRGLQLADVLDDLRRIAEEVKARAPATEVETLHEQLQSELQIRLADYLAFLGDLDCIEWDRSSGEIEPDEALHEPIESPEGWRDEVVFEFEDRLAGPENESSAQHDQPEGQAEASAGELLESVQEEEFEFDDDPVSDADVFGEDDESGVESLEVDATAADEAPEPDAGSEFAPIEELSPDDASAEVGDEEDDSDVEPGLDDASAEVGDEEDDSEVEPGLDDASAEVGDEEDDSEAEPGLDDASEPEPEEPGEAGRDSSKGAGAEASNTSEARPSDRSKSQSNRRNERETMARTSSRRKRYERDEEIGSGGLGTVYRGVHLPLDREVAIKEISNIFDVFADIQRDQIVERFRDITRAQAAISHPAVTQIFDLDTGSEYPFAVSEYAPNGSLRRLIEDEESRTLRVALKYFIQLLHGLNAAHREDLIHGNIKPENVLLDASGNAKLSDFGLSTLVDLEGASEQVYVGVGAVAYMAPEQFQNPNAATKRSDIYALGILFYEMLTGKVPGRRSPMPSSFYPEIPRSLDDIFDQMTMDAEEDRFESIESVLRAFYGAEEIVELLDRQSGVVFLRDPIEHGDEPLVGDEPQEAEASEEGEPEDVPQSETEAAEVDHEPEEGLDEESSEVEDEASDLEEDSDLEEASDLDEDSDLEETSEGEQDEEGLDEDSSDVEEIEAADQDDEVLEKIDEYGEMFEEE